MDKIFIRLITINQELTIVKFISQKNDLSSEQKYNSFNPELFIPEDNRYIYYEPNIYNYISNNNGIENPQGINEIQIENNNISSIESSNNNNNINININNDNHANNNNSNIFANQGNNNQVNLDSINVENEQKVNSTQACSSRSEIDH